MGLLMKSDNSGSDDDGENNNTMDKLLQENLLNDKGGKTWLKGVVAQSLVTGAVMLSSASCGMPVGFSAILLPQLKNHNGSLRIDDEIGSWIASVHSAATPVGSLLSGVLMDNCGRKLALQMASIPLILGWILIAFCNNHSLLLLGRLVAGFSVGLTAAAGQVFIGETSEPHLRGIFTSVPFASYSFGILLVYAFGSLLNWRIVAGISTVLPIVATTSFLFLPESPTWLIRKGRREEAKKALMWLRGQDVFKAKSELLQLQVRVENEAVNTEKSSWKVLCEPQVLKPMVIINVFNVLQILSGTYLIVLYAVDIISHIQNERIDSFLAAVLTACVRFAFTVIASVLLGIIGRRSLSISSGIGTAFSAFCLGFLILFQDDCSINGYFSAFFVLLYVATNTVGFMILPGVMLGELFPAKVRGLAGGLSFMAFNLSLFATAKVFPEVKNAIGMHGVFWVFSASSFVASVFLYLVLPETKGVSLGEIEDYFLQKNFFYVVRERNKAANEKEREGCEA